MIQSDEQRVYALTRRRIYDYERGLSQTAHVNTRASHARVCLRVLAWRVHVVHRRAARPIVRNGLARRRFIGTRTRRESVFFFFSLGRFWFLPGVDGPGGHPYGESPEGHDEDGEAEHEPEIHAPERRFLVFLRLGLVVLLGLLDSALPAVLFRGARRSQHRDAALRWKRDRSRADRNRHARARTRGL